MNYDVKPSAIFRKGSFLWQEDTPSGSGLNLWGALLQANNGYPPEYAEKAAKLFEAAPELLAEMRHFLPVLERLEDSPLWPEFTAGLGIATINGYRRAINKALGNS